MKFTSAPKKMLLTGLSAAMVVAFAPAVAAPLAQAKTGDAVTINLDAQGGTVAGGLTQISYTEGGSVTLPSATDADGYTLDHWWYDRNDDGKDESTAGNVEDYHAGPGFQIPTKADGSYGQIALKAVYNTPAISSVKLANEDNRVKVFGEDAVTEATIKITIKAPEIPTGTTLKLKVTKSGNRAALVDKQISKGDGNQDEAISLPVDVLTAGTYTAEITATKGTETKTVASKTLTLAQVDLKAKAEDKTATNGSYLYDVSKGLDFNALGSYVDPTDSQRIVSKAATKKWTGTTTLVSAGIDFSASGTYDIDRTATLTLPTKSDDKTYAVQVADPAGNVVYDVASVDSDTAKTINFVPRTANYCGQPEKAGTYIATVTETTGTGATATTKTFKFDAFTLTEVKSQAGTGAELVTKADKTKAEDLDVFTDDAAKYTVPTLDTIYKTSTGYDSLEYYFGGKQVNPGDKLKPKAGEVNTITVQGKAHDASKDVVAPTVTFEKVKVNGTDSIRVTASTTTPNAAITFTAGSETLSYNPAGSNVISGEPDEITVMATAAGLNASSKTYVKNTESDSFAEATTGTLSASTFGTPVGRTATYWADAENTAKAIAGGKAAIDGLGAYYENEAGAKTVKAAYKTLYEAVAKDAQAAIAPYADQALVTVGEKNYTLTTDQYKAAQKDISDIAKSLTDASEASDYLRQAGAVITKTNGNLKAAAESAVTKADIEAAAAVDKAASALEAVTDENYEAVYAAAQKAFADYDGLTAAQKPLVKAESVSKIAKALDGSAAKYQAAAKAAKEKADQDTKAAQDAQKAAEDAQAKAESKATEAQKAADAASAQLKAAQKTVSGVKVKAAKKKATVSWKKAKGYRFQVSYQQAGKKAQGKTTSKTKLTVKKLKGGQYYTFQVRTYKKVSGKTVYGQWSEAVSKKVK